MRPPVAREPWHCAPPRVARVPFESPRAHSPPAPPSSDGAGQKCSAQSMLFVHSNWVKAGLYDKLKALAEVGSAFDDGAGGVDEPTVA